MKSINGLFAGSAIRDILFAMEQLNEPGQSRSLSRGYFASARDGGRDLLDESTASNHDLLRLGLLNDEQVAVRRAAAYSLASEPTLPRELHSPLIEALLLENSYEVVKPLSEALCKTGVVAESLVAPLTTLLHHESIYVAEEAARALGKLPVDRPLFFLPLFLTGREGDTVHLRLAFAEGVRERGAPLSLAGFRTLADCVEEQPNKDIISDIREVVSDSNADLTDQEIAYVLLAATRSESKNVKREALKATELIVSRMDSRQRMAIAPTLAWAAPDWMTRGSAIQYRALGLLEDCKDQLPFSGQILLPVEENRPAVMMSYQAYTAGILGGAKAIQEAGEFLTEMVWSYENSMEERCEGVQYLGGLCHFAREEDAPLLLSELAGMIQTGSELPIDLQVEVIDTFPQAIRSVDDCQRIVTELACDSYRTSEVRTKACQVLGELSYLNSQQKNLAYRTLHYLQGEPDSGIARKARHALELLSLS
jgi:HEAT repeat protein